MKKLLLVSMFLVSCMQRTEEVTVVAKDGLNGVNGTSCSVTPYENGSQISCSNGTSTFVSNGLNGQDGSNGVNGTNGTNGSNGQIGPQGPPGIPGVQGQQGNGCTVDQVMGGAIVHCGASTAVITNGTDGAPTGSELIYAYDPCGDSSKVFNDEILFIGTKGNVYAYFEDNASSTSYEKQTRRISFLQPGSYITTDSKTNYCSFTVQSPSNYPNIITNEVQH